MAQNPQEDMVSEKGRKHAKVRRPFWRRLYGAAPFIMGGILLTLLYSDTALFRQLETTALDLQMLLRKPPDGSDVVVVRITNDDYQNPKLFHGKSPLDPAILQNIIGAIASGKPKVIGVDLDTSAKDFQTINPPPEWPPIIWARGATYSNVSQKYILSDALGGDNPYSRCGLVTLKIDSDGVIRRYTRWYATDAGPMPSLPWAVLREFRKDGGYAAQPSNLNEDLFISYAGATKYYPVLEAKASQILGMSSEGNWADKNLLKDKMVLLGGDYAVQDEHETPTGWMLGVEVLASIIETEQRGGGRQPISRPMILLLAVIDSIVLLLLIHVWGLRKILLISVVLIPALALACSLLVFGSTAYVGYFILILSAVLLNQVYDKGKEYYKNIKERAAEELE
jgi:CHASE2 domain-containing sensor protein